MASWYTETPDGVSLQVRVQPNAKTSEIVGAHNGRLKIRIQQPAVDGGANEGLIRFLSSQLGCSKSAIEIIRGAQIREKIILVRGVSSETLIAALPFFDL